MTCKILRAQMGNPRPGAHSTMSQSAPAFERTHEGDGIRMSKAGTGGHTLSNSGNGTAQGRELFCQVEGGGISLYIATNGQYNLASRHNSHAGEEFIHAQILRHDTIQGRNFAAKAMVKAAKRAAPLNGQHIRWLFHHTEEVGATGGVIAGGAAFPGRSKEAALRAGGDILRCRCQGGRKTAGIVAPMLQKPESQPLCPAASYSGHTFEGSYQLQHGGGIILSFHAV